MALKKPLAKQSLGYYNDDDDDDDYIVIVIIVMNIRGINVEIKQCYN